MIGAGFFQFQKGVEPSSGAAANQAEIQSQRMQTSLLFIIFNIQD